MSTIYRISLLILAVSLGALAASLNSAESNARTIDNGGHTRPGEVIYTGETVSSYEYTSVATPSEAAAGTIPAVYATVDGRGLGYGPAYWHAVGAFVTLDNDGYAAAYSRAPQRVQNVLYRAAYDSVTGELYEDFSYSGELVPVGEPVHLYYGKAPSNNPPHARVSAPVH